MRIYICNFINRVLNNYNERLSGAHYYYWWESHWLGRIFKNIQNIYTGGWNIRCKINWSWWNLIKGSWRYKTRNSHSEKNQSS